MKMIVDFFPVLVFFLTYRFFGIYVATTVAMIASGVQVIGYYLKHRRVEKMHVVSCVLLFVFGGATLFFHNPWYIKWKPTVIYWVMAVVMLGSYWIGPKTVAERMMAQHITLSSQIWGRINLAWALYFSCLGALNLYIAYTFSTSVWVTFKLFGGIGLTLLFVLLQAFYLTKHIESPVLMSK